MRVRCDDDDDDMEYSHPFSTTVKKHDSTFDTKIKICSKKMGDDVVAHIRHLLV